MGFIFLLFLLFPVCTTERWLIAGIYAARADLSIGAQGGIKV